MNCEHGQVMKLLRGLRTKSIEGGGTAAVGQDKVWYLLVTKNTSCMRLWHGSGRSRQCENARNNYKQK